jgi:hypothetical protein
MQAWAAADISSVILHSRHARVSLSPPNTPTKALPVRSATGVLFAPVAAQTQQATQAAQRSSAPLRNDTLRNTFRPVADAAPQATDSSHGIFRSNPPVNTEMHRFSSGSFASRSHERPSLARAASELRTSPPLQVATSSNTTNTSGRNVDFPHKYGGSGAEDSLNAEISAPLFTTGSTFGSISAQLCHAEQQTQHRSLTAQVASHAKNGVSNFDDSAHACTEERVLDSLRRQIVSNEVELLRQRLAIVDLELHNRNKDYEVLQRAAAVLEYRAEAAESALAELQQQALTPAVQHSLQTQVDASTSTSREMTLCPVGNDRADVGTQATSSADANAEIKKGSLLQQLIAAPAQSPAVVFGTSSVSPPKHPPSQKRNVLIEHVNAKADHLAEKLEELLFNMSVQQREFSKLSRTSSSLFRTLVQTLHAVAHCWSILSGGHDEQVQQRRYMMIDRDLEGRDVGVFASEACVLIEDAIDAVNLVNMLQAPAQRIIGKI